MSRAISHAHAGHYEGTPYDHVTLAHDERHLRRKLLVLNGGDQILVDFPKAVALADGDVLKLEDGKLVEIRAADEDLYEITAKTPEHLSKLCWHIGNRHLPAQIEQHRILIQRDHVIKNMLHGLGARVKDIAAPFTPEHGAYHADHGHSH